MSRQQDALDLRDQAFFFARDSGRLDRRGNRLTLCAQDEYLSVMFAHHSYKGREEWLCEIWFTPQGFAEGSDGRGFECLSVSWNARDEYTITTFKKGVWKKHCMTLNHDKFRAAGKGAHNQYVSYTVRELLNCANRHPGSFLRRQNDTRMSPATHIRGLISDKTRAVLLP